MSEAAGPERRSKQLQEVAIFNDVAKALTSSLNLDSILQNDHGEDGRIFSARHMVAPDGG